MTASLPKVLRLLYISPAFPNRNLVFEQNELLGLLKTNVSLEIFSCRKLDQKKELNCFAEPLLAKTTYFQLPDAVLGFAFALFVKPFRLSQILLLTFIGCLNPLFAPRVLGAFLSSFCLHRKLRNSSHWIHADFGGNTATIAMFLSILTSRPFSYKVHAYDIYSKNIFIRDPLRRIKARAARLILAEHVDGKRAYCKLTGISEHKVQVHYSCVRPDVFAPPLKPTSLKYILALGRFIPKKGFDILIRAVAQLKSNGAMYSVKIYGYGPEQGNLQALIEELGLNDLVQLCGAYDNDELISMFADCYALVMPSIVDKDGDRDGVPTVIYEAMACGVPAIASAIGGIPEVIQNGRNGLLVSPNNEGELAEAIKKLVDDTVLRVRLGRQARVDVVNLYDYQRAAKTMSELFSLPDNHY